MPEMDGIETYEKLKLIDGFDSFVIALTADAVEGSREKFLNAGFDEYIAKPINKQIFENVINTFLLTDKKYTSKQKSEDINNTSDANQGNIDYLMNNGIDVIGSFEILGDKNMYDDTLQDFLTDIPDKLEKIKSFKENRNMNDYAIYLHSLKSDSKYLGFTKLSELALQHELKSKENNYTFVDNNFNTLEEELNRVISVVKNYLS